MADAPVPRFNIRVYGLMINEKKEVLLSDEFQLDMKMTKFPGGGMNYGEGTRQCLEREFLEECNQKIEIIDHFYTTDFFQSSDFYPEFQLISIYYLVKPKGDFIINISNKAFDFKNLINGRQSFRWVSLTQLHEEHLTFPIDRLVLKMLREKFL